MGKQEKKPKKKTTLQKMAEMTRKAKSKNNKTKKLLNSVKRYQNQKAKTKSKPKKRISGR